MHRPLREAPVAVRSEIRIGELGASTGLTVRTLHLAAPQAVERR
jgi:hypothetical protein